jgi:hypothetical protein
VFPVMYELNVYIYYLKETYSSKFSETPHHEVAWGSGDIGPCILNLDGR